MLGAFDIVDQRSESESDSVDDARLDGGVCQCSDGGVCQCSDSVDHSGLDDGVCEYSDSVDDFWLGAGASVSTYILSRSGFHDSGMLNIDVCDSIDPCSELDSELGCELCSELGCEPSSELGCEPSSELDSDGGSSGLS